MKKITILCLALFSIVLTTRGQEITVSQASLSGFTYSVGYGPSAEQTFTAEGSNLGADISITAPINYEISETSGSNYTNSITLDKGTGTVASTTIYVRLVAGLLVSNYNEDIDITSLAVAETVSCFGSVTCPVLDTPPVASAATEVYTTDGNFTANWAAVSGADGYKLDVYYETTNATDLFISAYLEGSADNKYIAIYNGTGAAVDLSGYKLNLYPNGASVPSNSNALSGSLEDRSVVIYQNASASLSVTATDLAACNFNGDDAVALVKTDDSFVDIFGCIGDDPGVYWSSVSNKTQNQTLYRKSIVTGGVSVNPTSGFPTLESEWTENGQDYITDIDNHTLSIPSAITYFLPGFEDKDMLNVLTCDVSGVSMANEYKYVVRASNACGNVSENSNEISIFDGFVNTDGGGTLWHNNDTWTSTAPTLDGSQNAVVRHPVTIPYDYYVWVKNLWIVGNGSITLQSQALGTASLIASGKVFGNITVQRYLTPNIYHYISAPVATGAMSAADFGLSTAATDIYDALYAWDETVTATNGEWTDILRSSMPYALTAARGYAYCAGGASSGAGFAQTVDFTGTVRGDFDYTATYTNVSGEGGLGWHVLGNPYPSTIAVNQLTGNGDYLLNNNGINEIYLWNEPASDFDEDDYITVNNAGVVDNEEGEEVEEVAVNVQPGQAFMTRVYANTTTISFNRDMCNPVQGSFYKAADPINRMSLNVESENGVRNQTLVAFKNGLTDGYDASYDSEKLKGNPQIALYTKMVDGTAGDWAIQSLDEARLADAKVWVGLDARTDDAQNDIDDGKYTFSIGNPDDFIGEVFLEDIKEGAFHNLRESNYVTSVDRGYHTDRFVLHFREVGGKITTDVSQNVEATSFKVFSNNGSIYTIDATGEVEVFDLAGRRVAVTTINESTNCVARNLTPGAYIVKSANGTEKVIVQ